MKRSHTPKRSRRDDSNGEGTRRLYPTPKVRGTVSVSKDRKQGADRDCRSESGSESASLVESETGVVSKGSYGGSGWG